MPSIGQTRYDVRRLGTRAGLCAALRAAFFVLFAAAVGLMNGPAQADQRIRPVVALECAAKPKFCRSLVQAMAEIAPSAVYRINPDPAPLSAVTVRVTLGPGDSAQLSWSGGARDVPRPTGHTDAQFAQYIVSKGGNALAKALKNA